MTYRICGPSFETISAEAEIPQDEGLLFFNLNGFILRSLASARRHEGWVKGGERS